MDFRGPLVLGGSSPEKFQSNPTTQRTRRHSMGCEVSGAASSRRVRRVEA